MNKRRLSYGLIFKGLFVLGFVVLIGIAMYYDHVIENQPGRYVIGTITDFERGANVPPWFKYEFIFKKQKFEGQYSIANKLSTERNHVLRAYIGQKYFVKVNPNNPDVNRLMISRPVWDNIKDQPYAGWIKLPKK